MRIVLIVDYLLHVIIIVPTPDIRFDMYVNKLVN